jgi:hypothetical protein
MTETYTFSRALYLMRYGGKKMKSDRTIYEVYKGELYEFVEPLDSWVLSLKIYAEEIMGSWIEVKDES